MTDIHDIKPPIDTPINYLPLWIILAIFVVIIASYLIWKYRKKLKKEKKQQKIKQAPIDYQAQAMKKLKKIEKLLEAGEIQKCYKKLSLLLRWYLEMVHQKPFIKMTTEEILQRKKVYSKDLENILKKCDLVNFAKKPGTKNEAHKLIHSLKKIINSLTR